MIREVKVVRCRGEFSRERVYLFYDRHNAVFLAKRTDFFFSGFFRDGNLRIGEARALRCRQNPTRGILAAEFFLQTNNILHFFKEPRINVRKRVDFFYGNARAERFREREDALCRGVFYLIEVVRPLEVSAPVERKAVSANRKHPDRFLQNLLERAADGHHFPDGFHLGSDARRRILEFHKVPARHLEHKVVERGLEAGRCRFGYGILQIRQRIAERKLRRDKCQGVSGCFRCQGGRARQTSIDFDDAVITVFRIQRILDIAFPDNAEVPDGFEGDLTEVMVLRVRQSLRWCNDHRLSRVDAHGIHILHVAHRHAVVRTIPHDFVFDLFPPLEILFNQNLRDGAQNFRESLREVFLVCNDARSFAAQGECGAHHDGESDRARRLHSFRDRRDCFAFRDCDADLAKPLHKKGAVFRVADRRNRRAEHFHAVFLEDAFSIEREPEIQGSLPTERKKYRVGAFFAYHFCGEFDSERQKVHLIGQGLIRLHGCDIRIHEDDDNALFL